MGLEPTDGWSQRSDLPSGLTRHQSLRLRTFRWLHFTHSPSTIEGPPGLRTRRKSCALAPPSLRRICAFPHGPAAAPHAPQQLRPRVATFGRARAVRNAVACGRQPYGAQSVCFGDGMFPAWNVSSISKQTRVDARRGRAPRWCVQRWRCVAAQAHAQSTSDGMRTHAPRK